MEAADEAKGRGNAAFSSGNFSEAVKHYSDAIALSPSNHILYSNRSAAHTSLGDHSSAQKTFDLDPTWLKGYSRLGAAYFRLCNYPDSITAYNKGLEIDPNSDPLISGLAAAESAAPPSRFGYAFSGPKMLANLKADPAMSGFLRKPEFVKMMRGIQSNPSNLNLYLKDPGVMQSLGVLLNDKDKDQVIENYSKWGDLNDGDIFFLTDRASVYLEMGKYEDCIRDCNKVVERGRETGSDNKMVAKALTRKGTAIAGMAKCPKDVEFAIKVFQKALTEHHYPDTLEKLHHAEEAKKELQDYFDKREKGNEFYKLQQYQEGLNHDPDNAELIDGVGR